MAHPDLDRLLGFCIPFAQDQLNKRDEFYPFAAAIDSVGELSPIAIDSDGDKPIPSEMIADLKKLLSSISSSKGLQATSICYDGRVTVSGKEKQDAITVLLEHLDGECVTIYLPYKKKLFRGYVYDPIIGAESDRAIFV